MYILSNKQCNIQSALINLHPNGYSQELHSYQFTVNLDSCVGSCNSLNVLSNKVCIPNEIEDLNLSVFNLITGINKWKILRKQISCEYKCKLDGRMCNSNEKRNNHKCWCECKSLKEHHKWKKIIFRILHVVVKMLNS